MRVGCGRKAGSGLFFTNLTVISQLKNARMAKINRFQLLKCKNSLFYNFKMEYLWVLYSWLDKKRHYPQFWEILLANFYCFQIFYKPINNLIIREDTTDQLVKKTITRWSHRMSICRCICIIYTVDVSVNICEYACEYPLHSCLPVCECRQDKAQWRAAFWVGWSEFRLGWETGGEGVPQVCMPPTAEGERDRHGTRSCCHNSFHSKLGGGRQKAFPDPSLLPLWFCLCFAAQPRLGLPSWLWPSTETISFIPRAFREKRLFCA